MANIYESAISILAGNLNSDRSYLTTSVTIVVALQIKVAEDELNKKLKTSQWKFESSRC